MMQDRERGPFEELGEAMGGALGKAAGRANDAALDALGSVLERTMRTMGDWWAGAEAESASRSFGPQEDRACREHFRGPGTSADDEAYRRVQPMYRFGYVASRNPAYDGRPFDEVEAELQRTWERAAREEGLGDWSSARERVGFGYTYRAPGAPNAS
jgi:hypothetical protein